MGLAWDMRYDLYYLTVFALGIVTLLAQTAGQLAIIDLKPSQEKSHGHTSTLALALPFSQHYICVASG